MEQIETFLTEPRFEIAGPLSILDLIPYVAAVAVSALFLRWMLVLLRVGAPVTRADIQDWFGISRDKHSSAAMLYWVLAAFGVLFLMALATAFTLLANVLHNPLSDETTANTSFGLGALLVALLSAPFLIWRSIVAQKSVNITQHGQVTQRINEAVEALGTEKIQRYEGKDAYNNTVTLERTAPNMEVRIGAILALGRIAEENLDFHVQVMQIICAYVRENAPAKDAEEAPAFPKVDETLTGRALREAWTTVREQYYKSLTTFAANLPPPRADIQTALEVLGRRSKSQKLREASWPDNPNGDVDLLFDAPLLPPPKFQKGSSAEARKALVDKHYTFRRDAEALRVRFALCSNFRLDLRGTNLQAYNLSRLDLGGARLHGARLECADVWRAKLQGVGLIGAQLQGTRFVETELQGSGFWNAQAQGARFTMAQLQGADLGGAQMQGADLRSAKVQGAFIQETKWQGAEIEEAHLEGSFLANVCLQGANLEGAHLQGAFLGMANLNGASLAKAHLDSADLLGASMQGAELVETEMGGVRLAGTRFSEETNVNGATFSGAALSMSDEPTIRKLQEVWHEIFADGTVDLLESTDRPTHWFDANLNADEADPNSPFANAWRAWAAQAHPDVIIAPYWWR